MFLTARLFGIFTYAVLLVLVCLSLKHTNNIKKYKLFLLLYLCCLVIMAFFYVPYITADLYRLSYISEIYASMSFDDLFNEILNVKTPGAVIYFYLIGLLHNYHFIPAISILINFSLLFSIVNSEIKRTPTKGTFIASSLFLLMSSSFFMSSISGVRNMMAYCIIIFCIYREFILKNNFLVYLPLYFIAASLHTIGQVILIYRIIFLLFEKSNYLNRIVKILICICLIFFIIKYGQYFINGILDKGFLYHEEFKENIEYFYIWGLIISVIEFILIIYELFLFYNFKKYLIKQYNCSNLVNIIYFIIPLIIVAFVSYFFSFVTYGRVLFFVYMLMFPTTLILLKYIPQNKQKNVQINLLFINTIILILNCTRGDLCSLKFWE